MTVRRGKCSDCGKRTWSKEARRCKKCYVQILKGKTGEKNVWWNKHSSTKKSQGWDRAIRRFPLGMCERCEKAAARDRHHKDDNPLNNVPSNVMRLCRRCHMIVDGRMAGLKDAARKGRETRTRNARKRK